MPAWPTPTDLREWQDVGPAATTDDAVLAAVLASARAHVESRVDEDLLPEDDSCPDSLRLAIILIAARLLTRRQSANGVIAHGEWAVRVSRTDPDVDELIFPYALGPEP